MKARSLLALVGLVAGAAAMAQANPRDARAVILDAQKQAAQQHKNVFIKFHASW